jgi:phosphohistidine phosphatase
MKTLLLMRHAKSSWKDDTLTDEQRPLNKRGRRDAPRMGQMLRELDLAPQVITSSPAARARETAVAVAEACGFEGEIVYEASLYEASVEACLAVAAGLPDAAQVALLVGHNPSLEALVAALTGADEHMTTAAIARVALPIERWAELGIATEGHLETILRSREPD